MYQGKTMETSPAQSLRSESVSDCFPYLTVSHVVTFSTILGTHIDQESTPYEACIRRELDFLKEEIVYVLCLEIP